MKIEVGSCKATTQLSMLLRQVKAGVGLTITNRGKVIVVLVPSTKERTNGTAVAADRLLAFILGNPVRGMIIKELLGEGRA